MTMSRATMPVVARHCRSSGWEVVVVVVVVVQMRGELSTALAGRLLGSSTRAASSKVRAHQVQDVRVSGCQGGREGAPCAPVSPFSCSGVAATAATAGPRQDSDLRLAEPLVLGPWDRGSPCRPPKSIDAQWLPTLQLGAGDQGGGARAARRRLQGWDSRRWLTAGDCTGPSWNNWRRGEVR